MISWRSWPVPAAAPEAADSRFTTEKSWLNREAPSFTPWIRKNAVRFSHENEEVRELYHNYFGKPGSHLAHKLLHTDHNGWDMPLGGK